MSDPLIRQLRDQLAERDRAVLDAVNARLKLVAELKRHKDAKDIPFNDPDQEQRLLKRLVEANGGPLSDKAARELFEKILELTKQEINRA